MATRNTKLLWRDSFLCTVLTLVVSGIFLLIFVNLSVLDPFYKGICPISDPSIRMDQEFHPPPHNVHLAPDPAIPVQDLDHL